MQPRGSGTGTRECRWAKRSGGPSRSPRYKYYYQVYPRAEHHRHWSVDSFMVIAADDLARLGYATGDKHYGWFASFLRDAAVYTMDWDGKLGYGLRGLMNEAVNLAHPRGHGVRKWLPWLSVAVLEGMGLG